MRDSQVFMSLPRPPKLTLKALLKSSIGLQKQYSSVSKNLKTSSYILQLGRILRPNVSGSGSGKTHLAIGITNHSTFGLV